MTRPVLVSALALVVFGAVTACQPAAPPDDGSVTIRAARVFDGLGAVLANGVVVVRDSQIVAVDTRSGPVTHDLGDVTLMPGLIDTHTHVDWHFQPNGLFGQREGQPRETDEQRDAAIAANLEATLLAGFTTVQNVGNRGDAQLREHVAAGEIPGPRILTSLGQISARDRSGPMTPDRLRARVQELKVAGADLIKVFASESIRVGGGPTMSQEQLDAVCGEARTQGLRTLVHAHAAEAILRVVRAGCWQVEHGAYASDESLALMRDEGVYFDPNIGLVLQNYVENKDKFMGTGNYNEEGFAFMEAAVADKTEMFQRAVASGVKMPLGTDAVAGAHGQNAREIIARVSAGGQDAMDALIGATSLAAESLGMDETLGRLAPGYEADIIAVQGDPVADIARMRDVVFVMQGGRVVRGH